MPNFFTRKNRVNRMSSPPSPAAAMVLGNSPVPNTTTSARANRDYQMRHAKSRVANVLGTPGEFKYTNKERIEEEYKTRLQKIATSLGVPLSEIKEGMQEVKDVSQKETVNTMRSLGDTIETAMKRNPTATVVTITLSVGLAQLAVKVLRIMVAFFVFWLALPLALFHMFEGLPYLIKEILPNTKFNTTRTWHNWIKGKVA